VISKAGAKLLLFFELCKNFEIKMREKCIFSAKNILFSLITAM